MNKEYVKNLKMQYPKETRIKLISMDDPQAPIGQNGTVVGVDDMGQIMVKWDNGSSLSVILEAGDVIEKI